MKKLSLLLMALLLVSTGIFAQATETRPKDDPNFNRAKTTIHPIWDWSQEVTIDGKADEGFWKLIDFETLPLDISTSWFVEGTIPAAPSADFDVKWKSTMDEDFFYLYVEVTDANFVPRSAVWENAAWDNDNIEVFFLFADTTVVMPDWALQDASQFRIWPDTDVTKMDSITGGGLVIGNRDNLGHLTYTSRTVQTATGYNVETRIPWILIHPSEDGILGYENDDNEWVPIEVKDIEGFQFDINVADRDNPALDAEPKRKAIWSWSANWSRNWGFTEAYGWLTVGAPLSDVSVPSIRESKLKIYPNPAINELNVANLEGKSTLSITNIVGQEVYRNTVEGNTQIDIAAFKNGVYFLSVINEAGARKVEKFIKK
jgi:hypothetical protein